MWNDIIAKCGVIYLSLAIKYMALQTFTSKINFTTPCDKYALLSDEVSYSVEFQSLIDRVLKRYGKI